MGAPSVAQITPETTVQLLKLMPVPLAHEQRFALRRRAIEIMGMLEGLAADDHAGRAALTAELVGVAEAVAGTAAEARRNGLDPLTLNVLARHSPAGRTLLEMTGLPQTFSHSQLGTYNECPLQYAFQKVYRIPTAETPGYFEFGHVIHSAFEVYARSRRDGRCRGAAAARLRRAQAGLRRGLAAASLCRRSGGRALRQTRRAGAATLL